MNRPILAATFSLAALLCPALAVEYTEVRDFIRLPDITGAAVNQHGDVAVSSAGEIYVSTMNPKAGVQVFTADGKFLRNLHDVPYDLHGFVIHQDREREFIYGACLDGQAIVKISLYGQVVAALPASAIPDEFKLVMQPKIKKNANGEISKNPDDGKPFVRLTSIDVAPNGDFYVADGYGSDYVHRFDRNFKYIASFGGKKEPYGFKTLHKIAIDTRFTPARILGVDQANGRVVQMSLEGEFLKVVAHDMLLPAALAIQGDYVAIGELKGQVTILDKAGKVVAKFGTNTNADEAGKNTPSPATWRPGVVTAPHGVAFTASGDLLVSEYSLYGRVHRFNRQ